MADGDLTVKDEVAAWNTASDKIREVVKWIASAFGALGALLIGTAPLSGLSAVDVVSLPFLAATLFGLIALGSVAFIVWVATSLLAPSALTLNDLDNDDNFSALKTQIAAEPSSFLGSWGTDVATFVANRDREYALLAAVDAEIAQTSNSTVLPQLRTAHTQLVARIESMGRVSSRLLAAAGFHDLATRFASARPRMFRAAAFTVVGIVGFVLTVGTAEASSDESVTKLPARVSLTEEGAKSLGTLLGEDCAGAFEVLVLSGGSSGPWEALVTDPRCQAGVVELKKTEAKVMLTFK